jgi:hypothetical protein
VSVQQQAREGVTWGKNGSAGGAASFLRGLKP